MNNKLKPLHLLLLTFFIFSSCENPKEGKPESPVLVEAELVGSFSKVGLQEKLKNEVGDVAGQVSLIIQNDIDLYKLRYNTLDLYGQPIVASGALIVPEKAAGQSLPMASLQHGTLFDKDDAPSNFRANTEATFGEVFGALGLVVGMPDYVGYGASASADHPYEHNMGLAVANADFIRAMKEFMDQDEIKWNGKLMLAGYSEGGYATMATHKYLQENYSTELPVTISVCGAGAYNKTATFNFLINNEGPTDPTKNRSYIWVLETYNKAYSLGLDYSSIFKEPYASKIEADGLLSQIDVSLNETFTPAFVSGFNMGNPIGLLDAVAENDVYNWKPKAEVRLYHGKADDYVPFINSQTAYDQMLANGAENVSLRPINGGNHESSVPTFLLGVLEAFLNAK